MDCELYFCADGVIRVKYSDKKAMIPLRFLQENSPFKNMDLRFLVQWWNCGVYFEEGLTVSKFLFCLEPWASFWTEITGKDIVSYIKEVRKPVGLNNNDDKLDWIEISCYTEINANIEYEKNDINNISNINEWFSTPKNIRLNGEWDIFSSYKVNGFVKGIEESYSIDYTPINKLANTLLVLNNKQIVCFGEWYHKKILGDNSSIFKKNAFGVCTVDKNINFLVGDKYHKLRDVVEGFFKWMFVNPESLDRAVDDIKSICETVEIEKETKNSKIVDINKAKKGDLKIKIADNAFSPLVNKLKSEAIYWDKMLKLASSENKIVLKIGKTKINISPEKRIYGYIISEKDKTANPQKTEYCLV